MVRQSSSARHRLHLALVLAAAVGACGASGCGEATVPSATTPQASTVKTSAQSSAPAAAQQQQQQPARPQPSSVVARIDASSDAVLAEGKVHIAAGAASDAEIRREIRAARKAGIVLPSGDSAASFEQAQSYVNGQAPQIETPETAWNPRSKPIATWIVPILTWAYAHGWGGIVTSGYRSYYEQLQLNLAGAYSAQAGRSNHETTVYPGGAVDVTEPSRLIAVLHSYTGPLKLVGGVLGPVDPEHFSATGD